MPADVMSLRRELCGPVLGREVGARPVCLLTTLDSIPLASLKCHGELLLPSLAFVGNPLGVAVECHDPDVSLPIPLPGPSAS